MKAPQNVNVIPMKSRQDVITTVAQLLAAAQDPTVPALVVRGQISNVPGFRLAPGQSLEGESEGAVLRFVEGSDGVELTSNNEVYGIRLQASPEKRAIYNDTTIAGLGRIRLVDIVAIGQVQILARDAVRSGHVDVDGLDIAAADTFARSERPHGFGVDVLQGAFTLWNMHADESVTISARLVDLAAGREGAPVRGSGIFVSGGGVKGGRVNVSLLETRDVYVDSKIPADTSNLISGGVFTVHGAHVDLVQNKGPVVTYGVNDMVLDNWGHVDRWVAEQKLTSYGASGIGFVNFGALNELKVEAPIETFGAGARGFNVYAGTVLRADFDRITTHADGAVGIQVSQPIGRLVVRRGVKTFGGIGQSLVKGVVKTLAAVGLSIKAGGAIDEIEIDGGIVTKGPGVPPIEVHGAIGAMRISGGVATSGEGFAGA